MYHKEDLFKFSKYKAAFAKLDRMIYTDFIFNNLRIKPMGFHYMDYGPGWIVKKHSHSFFEAHYIVQGTNWTTFDSREYMLETEQFYVLAPGTMHSHRQINQKEHLGFVIRWELDSINKPVQVRQAIEFDKLGSSLKNIPAYPVKDDGRVFDAMLNLLKISESSSLIELQLAFLLLVFRFCDTYKDSGLVNNANIDRNFIDSNNVNTAIKFINENFYQDIDVQDVANSVHLSYSHLSRLFKAYTTETVNQYINHARVGRAQYLLKCTEKDIESISGEVGFKSDIYFCSIFKKLTGMSPSQYRKTGTNLTE